MRGCVGPPQWPTVKLPAARYVETSAVFLVFFLLTLSQRDYTFSQMYMARDLDRAFEVLNGKPIWFGPELSGGGHLPGGFFYYLLAFFVAFPGGWENAFLGVSLLTGAAAAFGYLWLRERVSLWAMAGAVLTWPFIAGVRSSIIYFGNPSFLPLFVTVAMAGVLALFSGNTRNRRRTFTITAIAFALGVQMHMTVLFLLVVAALLQLAPRRLGFTRLTWNEMKPGLLITLLIFTPWLVWKAANASGKSFGQPSLVTAISDQTFDDSSEVELGQIRSASRQFRRSIAGYSQIVREPFFLIFLGLALLALFFPRPGRIDEKTLNRQIVILLVLIVISTLPVLSMDRGRYYLCVSVAIALLIPLVLEKMRTRRVRMQIGILLSPVLLYVLWKAQERYPTGSPPLMIGEAKYLANEIHQQTGWSFNEARERLFYIGAHGGSSLRYPFSSVEQRPVDSANQSISGYFVIKTYTGPAQVFLRNPAEWIAQELAPELSEAIRTGSIQLGAPVQAPVNLSRMQRNKTRVFLLPYFVRDTNLPPYFQNRFEEYSALQPQEIADLERKAAANPYQTAVAVFNSCETQPAWCRFAISAESKDLRDPSQPVRVRILGLPMSFISRRVSAGWNQMLDKPFVTRFCESGSSHKSQMVEYVGLPGLANPLARSYGWMAPVTRDLPPLDCKRIRKIELGFAGAEGSDLERSLKIPGDQRDFILSN